jgi:hypothetical protein
VTDPDQKSVGQARPYEAASNVCPNERCDRGREQHRRAAGLGARSRRSGVSRFRTQAVEPANGDSAVRTLTPTVRR